jgi:hypothetical protein
MVFVHVWAKGRHFVSRLICYGEPICILAQRHIRQMRIPLHWTAQFCFVVVAPLAVEAVLRLYVTYVTKRDHLFRSDVQTGWCNPPNLLTTRINATGEEWSIRTDQNGQRLIAQNLRAKYRILILGDSLRRHRHRRSIRRRCIATRRFVGRAKPSFEKADGSYVLRPPSIGLWERLSDWSFVASVIARLIEPSTSENLDPIHSIEIIRLILGQIHEEAPRGVRVVLAHQGTYDFLRPRLSLSSTIFCQFADACVDLDDALAADPAHLLPDGHWSVSGHATVTQTLLKVLCD